MAINLLDMLKDQIGDAVISQAGSFLGAENSGVKSAMGAALPSILGSMIASGSTSQGSKGLIDMITNGGHDGGVFDNLGSMLGGGDATSGFLNSGSGILKSLMGNKLGSVVDIIASVSGLNKGASSSIMSMAAPLVMGMVGKYVKSKALDALGLSKFLGGQSQHVASALPAGMGNLLGFSMPSTPGFGDMGDKVEKAAAAASGTVAETAGAGGGLLKKLLPVLLIAGLGFLGWNMWKGGSATDAMSGMTDKISETTKGATGAIGDAANKAGDMAKGATDAVGGAIGDAANKAGDMAKGATDAVGDAANAAGDMAKDAANKTAELANAAAAKAKAALAGIKFSAGSVGEKFSTWLATDASGEKSFRFKNLTFATGSSVIQDMTEVNNLAAVMNAYPSINIEVGGHTDSRGNAASNMKLSEARATSVMNQLVAKGIAASRISAKGYASTMPVTANPKDAINRRVEIKASK